MKLTDFSVKRSQIFASHGKEEKDIKEDVQILREWMNKVPHLPADQVEDEFLELCLLKNKFSIEKSKKKIEMYFTSKGDPHYQYLYDTTKVPVPSKEPEFRLPLPMLTDDNKRLILNVVDDNSYDMTKDANAFILLKEFLVRYDYNDGEIFICDMRQCTPKIVTKLRINVVADTLQLVLKVCSSRISEAHVISGLEAVLRPLINTVLPAKVAAKVRYHNDEEALKKAVPAKFLPSDFGGDLKSVKEFRADWDAIFEENQEYLRKLVNMKAREELRLKDDSKNEDIQGTFKKLNID